MTSLDFGDTPSFTIVLVYLIYKSDITIENVRSIKNTNDVVILPKDTALGRCERPKGVKNPR